MVPAAIQDVKHMHVQNIVLHNYQKSNYTLGILRGSYLFNVQIPADLDDISTWPIL